jgi:hypothetical protein
MGTQTSLQAITWYHDGVAQRITSSAKTRSVGGIVIPSAWAVLRLRTSSKFIGCSMSIEGQPRVECRKTYGRGAKRTEILGMGCSTPRLASRWGYPACADNGRFLAALRGIARPFSHDVKGETTYNGRTVE